MNVGRNESLEGVALPARARVGHRMAFASRIDLRAIADVAKVAGQLSFDLFCQRHGARDEQVCMFELDNQLTGACRVGLTFCLHVGDRLPAMLGDAAKAELMMLREAMPGKPNSAGDLSMVIGTVYRGQRQRAGRETSPSGEPARGDWRASRLRTGEGRHGLNFRCRINGGNAGFR